MTNSPTTQHETTPHKTKACVACKTQIPSDASLCFVCKSYQQVWKNRLQYIAGVATLIVLGVSAIFWLYEKVRATFFYRENVGIVVCNTLLRTVVIANRGDKDVFVTRLQFWMPDRTSDWEAPYLEINQSVAPGQFLKAEIPKCKLDGAELIRGMAPAEFEKLVSKAANIDPCLELDFFAGFDTHFADLLLMAGPTLNTFQVAGNLEYVGAKQNTPVRVRLAGGGVVRRSIAPECRPPAAKSK